MKENKILAFISLGITVISGILSVIFEFGKGPHYDYGCNVALSLFGSGALATITAIIMYFNSKRKTLSNFGYYTRGLLRYLKKYDVENMSLDEKVDYFLEFYLIDKSGWDSAYEDISFLHDNKKKLNFIRDNIYLPIVRIDEKVIQEEHNLSKYKKKEGNKTVIEHLLTEIEELFIAYIDGINAKAPHNKIVADVMKALRHEYKKL